MQHDDGVDAVERAVAGHEFLAPAALLGRGAEQDDGPADGTRAQGLDEPRNAPTAVAQMTLCPQP